MRIVNTKNDNELSLKAAGALVHIITRSSPASIIFWFYAIFSLFCFAFWLPAFWSILTIVVFGLALVLWVLKPERLWTEKHSLEMKKLDLTYLGDKKNPQVVAKEYLELFRPVGIKKLK